MTGPFPGGRQRRNAIAGFVMMGAFVAASTRAFGQERDEARSAYDDAARAYETRDFARAAKGFARADALAPNALALKLALAAALQADDAVLAEELALRAESRETSADIQELARSAHRRARGRVGRLRVACVTSGSCVATVSGRQLHDGDAILVPRGRAEVVFVSGAGRKSSVVVVVTDTDAVLASEPPAPAPPATVDGAAAPRLARIEASPSNSSARPPGLSPVFFWIGVGATAVLGGATAVSALETESRYDDFVAARTEATRSRGQAAELRTNVLLGASILSAVITGTIAIWFTRWSARDTGSAASSR